MLRYRISPSHCFMQRPRIHLRNSRRTFPSLIIRVSIVPDIELNIPRGQMSCRPILTFEESSQFFARILWSTVAIEGRTRFPFSSLVWRRSTDQDAEGAATDCYFSFDEFGWALNDSYVLWYLYFRCVQPFADRPNSSRSIINSWLNTKVRSVCRRNNLFVVCPYALELDEPSRKLEFQ